MFLNTKLEPTLQSSLSRTFWNGSTKKNSQSQDDGPHFLTPLKRSSSHSLLCSLPVLCRVSYIEYSLLLTQWRVSFSLLLVNIPGYWSWRVASDDPRRVRRSSSRWKYKQTLRFVGGLYFRQLWERAGGAILSVLLPLGGWHFPTINKIHDTGQFSTISVKAMMTHRLGKRRRRTFLQPMRGKATDEPMLNRWRLYQKSVMGSPTCEPLLTYGIYAVSLCQISTTFIKKSKTKLRFNKLYQTTIKTNTSLSPFRSPPIPRLSLVNSPQVCETNFQGWNDLYYNKETPKPPGGSHLVSSSPVSETVREATPKVCYVIGTRRCRSVFWWWSNKWEYPSFVYSSMMVLKTNPTVMVMQLLGKKSIQTIKDKSDILRHIVKNVSKRLVRFI